MTRLSDLPTAADVAAAARRLDGVAVRTPLIANPVLDEAAGRRVWVKAECLQRTGSFKFRGAFNRISTLPAADRAAGVVAYSSGNHAQGVAEAARIAGLPALVVMPDDAPETKVARTRRSGAEIVFCNRWSEDRVAIASSIAARRGATLVPPFDDPAIVAGQGTVGREILEQLAAIGEEPPAVLAVPCGGGGLTAGCALAFAQTDTRLVVAEPAGFDDTARSLIAGKRLAVEGAPQSICDALLVPTPGELTFAINRKGVSGGVAVSDDEVYAAMAFAFNELKIVVEPGGAAALAAVLAGKIDAGSVVVIASGGNVDPLVMNWALAKDR